MQTAADLSIAAVGVKNAGSTAFAAGGVLLPAGALTIARTALGFFLAVLAGFCRWCFTALGP